MTTTVNYRIAPRADTAANFTSANPVLALREMARETDTGKCKFGDGATAWTSLPYWAGGGHTDAEVQELARDAIGAALVAGAGITITPDDGANTITIASTVSAYSDENARDAIGSALAGSDGVAVAVDDGGDTITLRAGTAFVYPPPSGAYHLNVLTANALATVATAVNRFECYPMVPLASDMTISALGVYTTTGGGAGAKSRVGIYADAGGKPDGGALLCDSGDLDCSTTSTSAEGAVSLTLQKGKRYWLAILSNGTQTLRGLPLTVPSLGFSALSNSTILNLVRATVTFGALPSTAPATTRNNGTHVAIGLKVA